MYGGFGPGQNGGVMNTFAQRKWRSYRERLHNQRALIPFPLLSGLGEIVQDGRDRTAVHGDVGERP